MMLAHSLLESPVCINEGDVMVFVIENSAVLREMITGFKSGETEWVLSRNYTPLNISKCVEVIDSIFNIDFMTKKIISGINSEAERIADIGIREVENAVLSLTELGNLICEKIQIPVKSMYDGSVDKIIKLLNLSLDIDDMSMPEKLLLYMETVRNFLGKELFVFLNLKGLLSDEEVNLFYKNVKYEGFRVLLIESFLKENNDSNNKYERIMIIDKDLCII